ncbi:hypothetical protein CEP88_03855 [Roseobacter denitrificans]|nr:hypothetical protein CEP88_03855 [Roseobacter denitrificans]
MGGVNTQSGKNNVSGCDILVIYFRNRRIWRKITKKEAGYSFVFLVAEPWTRRGRGKTMWHRRAARALDAAAPPG